MTTLDAISDLLRSTDAQKLSPELLRRASVVLAEQRIELSDARLLSFPWQLIEHNRAGIVDDFARLGAKAPAKGALHAGAHIVGPEHVAVGAEAVIRAGAVLDASDGPIIIGARTVVMPNATIVGPVSIGAGSLVKAGARILACRNA